ncbi:branched-chain amino acid ABC transporter permease [Xanthobacter dioxanivorans]|uniref:branched-chain amino acid ABC transporter permease n=1 Tax=Xanthobacter dioxanivorans TaxID=2528964 RepID=UPI00193136E3|nr:branched-chain amino acid ABC transporter permease [Xanthobacter dioxanivorans]
MLGLDPAKIAFFVEVLVSGLLSGVLYAMVALGFVLIFKASGVFNFAQGAMVLVAGLALVRALGWLEPRAPFWPALMLAIAFSGALMTGIAWGVERFALRKLVNQTALTLFMATIGITFVLEGLGQQIFGAQVYKLDIGLPRESLFVLESVFDGGILLNQLDLWSAVLAALLVVALAVFFQRTQVGRALRAVADDHAAAQSVGIPLTRVWFIVWMVAGFVAIAAAAAWGSKVGVQFSLVYVALKALPVIIVGGLTSIPGAIVGGLLIGAGEKLAEVYLGTAIGGGIEQWFAYVVALLVLLVRPQGLFGDRIIERI